MVRCLPSQDELDQHASKYPTTHLFVFSPNNRIRKLCTVISTSKIFQTLIVVVIIVNCIILALDKPRPNEDRYKLTVLLGETEIYTLGIFIAEAVLEIMTQGFLLHEHAYLRSGWNILDFVVVVAGILEMPFIGLDAGPVAVLKALRVVRPLKLISGFPSLQIVMNSMLRSMASLLQVGVLVAFIVIIFGVVGSSFLMGKFHYTCFNNQSTSVEPYIIEEDRICGGTNGRTCPTGSVCQTYWDGPNYGITQFDNIFSSCLTIFTCITCEGWTDTMYNTFDAIDHGKYYVFMFYYSLNIIGAQFLLNLICGILSGGFAREKLRMLHRKEIHANRQAQMIEDKEVLALNNWVESGQIAGNGIHLKVEDQNVNDEADEDDEEEEKQNGGKKKVAKKKLKKKDFFKALKIRTASRFTSCLQGITEHRRGFRNTLKTFVRSAFLFWLVMVLIFLNVLLSAFIHYRQPQWITDLISISDIVFFALFFLEIALKLYALGPFTFFQTKFNKLDIFVLVVEIINLVISKVFGFNYSTQLRQFRLLRLFKFTRYYDTMKNLVVVLISSISSIISLLVLIILFVMTLALLGMQLFGGRFYARPGKPASRTNFDDFWNAMLAVFQIITGEDWNAVMYEGIIAYGGMKEFKGMAVSLYFVGVTVFGTYILLNLFLAIAVDSISLDSINTKIEATTENKPPKKEKKISNLKNKDTTVERSLVKTEGEIQEENNATKESTGTMKDEIQAEEMAKKDKEVTIREEISIINEFEEQPLEGGHAKPEDNFLENLKHPGRMTVKGRDLLQENALLVFPPTSKVRHVVHDIVTSQYFDRTILVFIIISSFVLAIEDTTDPEAKINEISNYLDYVFTTVFTLDVIIKIIDVGFAFHPEAYCRDLWNMVDLFVVVCSITSLVLSQYPTVSNDVGLLISSLRILRVIRPLKSINKLPKLKAVFQCMWYSLINIVNIIIILAQFLYIYSVMGISLFAGKFYSCSDKTKEWEEECQGHFITFQDGNYNRPVEKKRSWTLMDFNFDNIFNAGLSLSTASTGEGWPNLMQAAVDSQAEGQGPLWDNQTRVSIFFVSFVVIMSFFLINVFVGMIIITFKQIADSSDDSNILDRNKKNCFLFAMQSKPWKRYMPKEGGNFQYRLWSFVESTRCEVMICVLIVINTIVLMMEFNNQPEWYGSTLDVVNDAFTFIFIFECVTKIYAIGFDYFKEGWNIFDFIIVLGSLIGYIIGLYVPEFRKHGGTSLFRLFRALRLMKLFRRIRSIRILLWTFFQSFKALSYVGLLIFLLFFVYGNIGMQVFSLIDINSEEEPWAQINRNNNFRSYFTSTQVLFKVATGENWPNIMLACTDQAKCDKTLPAVGSREFCGSNFAYIYFNSFVFFCSFLMLNLFIAVIMDNFAFLTGDSSTLGLHCLDEFRNKWSEYDPCATGKIRHTEVCDLLRQMHPPLGLGIKCPKTVVYKRMVQMNMRYFKDGSVEYNGTFFSLVRSLLNVFMEKVNLASNDQAFKSMLKATWPNLAKRTMDRILPQYPKNSKHMSIGKLYTAKLIWENYKNMTKKKSVSQTKTLINVDNTVYDEDWC